MLFYHLPERIFFCEGKHEFGEKLDGVLHIIEVRGLHHGMHAAQWQGNKRAWDAFAAVENLVGIRAGEAAARFVLNGKLGLGGGVDETLDNEWMVRSAVGNGRTAAEFDAAEFIGIDAWGVRRMSDVEADTEVGFESVSRHHRTVAADFLLHGIEADDGVGGLLFARGEAFHHLSDDVAADAVVEGSADESFVRELHRSVLIDSRMSHAQSECGDFCYVRSSDVHPQVMHGGCFFLPRFVTAEVDGSVADDAGDRPLVAEDGEATAPGGGGIRATDTVDADEAIAINVLDDVADLVGVSLEHDDTFGLAGESCPSGAVGIAVDFRGVGLNPIRPDLLAAHFKAGGAGGFKQMEQELSVFFFHQGESSIPVRAGKRIDPFCGRVFVILLWPAR